MVRDDHLQATSNSLYAIALLGVHHGKLITGLSLAVERDVKRMEPQHLANSLWALGKLNIALRDTSMVVLEEMCGRQMKALDITHSIWALARLGCFEAFELEVRSDITPLEPYHADQDSGCEMFRRVAPVR
jgi:hypothetical protein